MVLNIKNFKVENTTTGLRLQSGRKTTSQLNNNLLSSTYLNNLVNETAVQGTPTAITGGGLVGKAYMGQNYIKIVREIGNIISNPALNNQVYIPDRVRITRVGGVCNTQNSLCYAWSSSLTKTPEELEWNVLMPNVKEQSDGDYFDIDLPDSTLYPNLYISFILIPNAWLGRTIIDASLNICSIPNNLDYFCSNPSFSIGKMDPNIAHTINIQGFNQNQGILTRVGLSFEDRYMAYFSDRDYNDITIYVSSVFFDDENINETDLIV